MQKRVLFTILILLLSLLIVPSAYAQKVCCKAGGGTTWADNPSSCTDPGGEVLCIEGQTSWIKSWGWYDIVTCGDIAPGTQSSCGAVTSVSYHTWGGFSIYPPPAGYPKWGDVSLTEEQGAEVLNGLSNQFTIGNQQQANALIASMISNPSNTQAATQLLTLYNKKEAFYANAMVYEFVLRGAGKKAFDSMPATSELEKQAKTYVANTYSRRLAGEVCKSGYSAFDAQWSTCWPKAKPLPVSVPSKISLPGNQKAFKPSFPAGITPRVVYYPGYPTRYAW